MQGRHYSQLGGKPPQLQLWLMPKMIQPLSSTEKKVILKGRDWLEEKKISIEYFYIGDYSGSLKNI